MKNENLLTTEYILKVLQGLPNIPIFIETFGEYHEVLKCFLFKTKRVARIRIYKQCKSSDFEVWNAMWINVDDIGTFAKFVGLKSILQ